jgi:hypothetical protein
VTVQRLIDPISAPGSSAGPAEGNVYIGVEISLAPTGDAGVDADVRAGSALVDPGGKIYAAVTQDVDPGSLRHIAGSPGQLGAQPVPPGQGVQGLVVFEVPEGTVPQEYRLTLNPDEAEATGTWALLY